MKRAIIESIEHSPHPRGVTAVRRLLSEELDTNDLDITYYEIEPGDQFAGAYHRHLEREEVFIVCLGTAVFRTEEGSIEVSAGESIYFAPGDWQLGRNNSTQLVTALLVGTPQELSPVEAYLPCPHCNEETRFSVEPKPQESGETMNEIRRCHQCQEVFNIA